MNNFRHKSILLTLLTSLSLLTLLVLLSSFTLLPLLILLTLFSLLSLLSLLTLLSLLRLQYGSGFKCNVIFSGLMQLKTMATVGSLMMKQGTLI